MLVLMFRVADDLYAIRAGRVVEVVPQVALRALPHAPEFLTGLFDYRGRVVPVIDLGLLMGRRACQPRLSTRIIVVDAALQPATERHLLGLVAEQVSDVKRFDDAQVIFPPMDLEQARYLGTIVRADEGLVQVIEVERVLTDTLRNALFGKMTEAR
ncbi:MAG: chemotaxis protein CheW [Isosphaeraceae bacterium]|nr:chemotaxis protein CheW [Isosphaeraceae bacterium]